MKPFKILIFLVFSVGIIFGGIKIYSEGINETTSKIDDLEKVNESNITKTYDGHYMSPLITVAKYRDEFNIELNNINKGLGLTLINPNTGDMVKIEHSDDGKYRLNTKLEKNVDYGILIDNRLSGSIRVVEDLKKVNDEEIYKEIMENLQCGL